MAGSPPTWQTSRPSPDASTPRTADDRNAALNDLARHADAHGQLIEHVIKYKATMATMPSSPRTVIRDDDPGTSEDEPPTAKKTHFARKPTT